MLASGSVDGHADKLLSHLGDAAAVAVTKVLAGRGSLSASEAESVLTVIHLAFSAPHLVDMQADKEPRTALFVLEYVKLTGADTATRARIERERNFVLDQAAKSKKP